MFTFDLISNYTVYCTKNLQWLHLITVTIKLASIKLSVCTKNIWTSHKIFSDICVCLQEACDAQASHQYALREIEAARKLSVQYQAEIELLKKEVEVIQLLRKRQINDVSNERFVRKRLIFIWYINQVRNLKLISYANGKSIQWATEIC